MGMAFGVWELTGLAVVVGAEAVEAGAEAAGGTEGAAAAPPAAWGAAATDLSSTDCRQPIRAGVDLRGAGDFKIQIHIPIFFEKTTFHLSFFQKK